MINLEKLGLYSNEVLHRSQMANILGGTGDASLDEGGTCGVKLANGAEFCGMSKSDALDAVQKNGGNWCCDSCDTASYC